MTIKKHLSWLLFISTAIIFTVGFRHYPSKGNQKRFFSTEKAQPRTIISMVKAKGILIPQEIIKVGNLINGIVRSLYVKENDLVKKGQLLAEIDDAREDADINATFGNLDAAQAVLVYQLEFLKRQEALFARNQVSLDGLQQAQRDYEAAYGKVEQAKGLHEAAKITYDDKQIHSPASGMIITKNVSVGQAVSNFAPSEVIYVIAKDVETLKAHIFLDANALEILKTDTSARMTIDTYPHKTFTGTIKEITGIPHAMELTDYTYARLLPKTEKTDHHCAITPIDNSDLSLRPGMTFAAQITVAEKENALSMPSQAFKINKHMIQQLAEELSCGYQPLEYQKLHALTLNDAAKTVWVYTDNTFIEKAVTVGINDADFTEIKEGITDTDEIVYEIVESKVLQCATAP